MRGKNNLVKNNQNKKKSIFLILMSAVIMISSFAFMTDRKSNLSKAEFGDLAILTDLTVVEDSSLTNLSPGDEIGMNLNIDNQGSLGGTIRTTYQVVVPQDEISKYKKDDFILKVNDNVLVDTVNVAYSYTDELLDARTSLDYSLKLLIESSILNQAQGSGFRVEVLTEIKQLNSPGWLTLRKEEVQFGHEADFKVVPSNDNLRTDEFHVVRGLVPGVHTTGYVATHLNSSKSYTVGTFKSNFLNDYNSLTVNNGVDILGDDELITTGAVISLKEGAKVLDELTVILKGDIDLDGFVNNDDAVVLNNMVDHTTKGNPLKTHPMYFEGVEVAGNMDYHGGITRNDYYVLADADLVGGDNIIMQDFYIDTVPMRRDPSFNLKMTNNDYLLSDGNSSDAHRIYKNGSEVLAGDIIEVGLTSGTIRGYELVEVAGELSYNDSYLELLSFSDKPGEIRVKPGITNDLDNPFSSKGNYLSSVLSKGAGVVGFDSYSQTLPTRADDRSDYVLKNSSELFMFSFKVKDDVPSGVDLDFKIDNLSFTLLMDGPSYTTRHKLSSSPTSTLKVGTKEVILPKPGDDAVLESAGLIGDNVNSPKYTFYSDGFLQVHGGELVNTNLLPAEIKSKLGMVYLDGDVDNLLTFPRTMTLAGLIDSKSIIFGSNIDTTNVTSMARVFRDSTVESIDFGDNFNTSRVTDMAGLFLDATNIEELDLRTFDTSSVRNMSNMFTVHTFSGTSSLHTLDISNFNTGNVTDMSGMFTNTRYLSSLDVSHFNTSKVTEMNNMFSGVRLKNLDISNFTTERLTRVWSMFSASRIDNLKWDNFEASQVTDFSSMFRNATIPNLDVSVLNPINAVDMSAMFNEFKGLDTVDLSKFTSTKLTKIGSMFSRSHFKELDLTPLNTSNVTHMGNLFSNMPKLTTLDISTLDTRNADVLQMFNETGNLTSIAFGANFESLEKTYFQYKKYDTWTLVGGDLSYTSPDLVTNWSSDLAGTWERNDSLFSRIKGLFR